MVRRIDQSSMRHFLDMFLALSQIFIFKKRSDFYVKISIKGIFLEVTINRRKSAHQRYVWPKFDNNLFHLIN